MPLWSIAYVLSIVAVNLSFDYLPPLSLWGDVFWSVGSVLAGAIFVLRDFSQREVGKWRCLLFMAVSGVITYLMASPFVAVASLLAFAVSELCDYFAFNLVKGGFRRKVLVSSLMSVPVDTSVFLTMIGHMSTATFLVMTLSKLLALGYMAVRK